MNIPTLRNGLTLAFEDLIWGRNGLTQAVSVDGFTVILGNTLRMGARELYETSETVYNEVAAIAREIADDESREEMRDRAELRRWRSEQ